jgi:hypothetical protein
LTTLAGRLPAIGLLLARPPEMSSPLDRHNLIEAGFASTPVIAIRGGAI